MHTMRRAHDLHTFGGKTTHVNRSLTTKENTTGHPLIVVTFLQLAVNKQLVILGLILYW